MRATRDFGVCDPLVVIKKRRVCAMPGCNTILSRYNPHKYCALHDMTVEEPPDPAGDMGTCRVCGPVPLSEMEPGQNICRSCRRAARRKNYRGISAAKWVAEPGKIRCTICGEVKDATPDNFRVDWRKPDLSKRCRECEAANTAKRKALK